MKLCLALLLLAFAIVTANALSDSEIKAIDGLRTSFPYLMHAIPPWTSNSSAACNNPPFSGLSCSNGPDPHVTALYFIDEHITGTMPRALGGLSWLERLYVEYSNISSVIPDTIGLLQNLTRIEIELEESPYIIPTHLTGLSALKNLKRLHLKAMIGGLLPFDFGLMSSLTDLKINCLGFRLPEQLPVSFWSLNAIESLDISGCNFFDANGVPSAYPPPFPRLENFTYSDGSLQALETILSTSRNLTNFKVGSYIDLPIKGFVGLSQLRKLDIAASSASDHIPYRFWETLPSLESVDFAPKISGFLSPSIGTLKHLRRFRVTQSRLMGTIPSELTLCPLQELRLDYTQLTHPLPDTWDRLNSTLRRLEIRGLQKSGTMPSSLGSLTALSYLALANSGLEGIISDLSQLSNLKEIFIENNLLTGQLPALSAVETLNAHTNRLTGTIPASIAATFRHLILSYNMLGPDLDVNLFASSKSVSTLDLSHNLFASPLPLISPTTAYELELDLSSNMFTGSIPANYCTVQVVRVSSNQLSGPTHDFFNRHCGIRELYINDNKFEGAIRSINAPHLMTLDISDNNFSGMLPLLPKKMMNFYAARNDFSSLRFSDFALSARSGVLEVLDLSGLGLSFPNNPQSIFDLVGPNMLFLYLARNQFTSLQYPHQLSTQLRGLDISDNEFAGPFLGDATFHSLGFIKAARNAFEGEIKFSSYPALAELDISQNSFQFEASDITDLPLLTFVHAQSNRLYGTLDLSRLPSLETADFSQNSLTGTLDLESISHQFGRKELRLLNISNNPNLIPLSMNTNVTGLQRQHSSSPSIQYPSMVCYELSFHGLAGRIFSFDEGLFNYSQCDCESRYFGFPPSHCVLCPRSGMSSCGGSEARIASNSFAYITYSNSSVEGAPGAPGFAAGFMDALQSFIAPISSFYSEKTTRDEHGQSIQMYTESCLVNALQRLNAKSNCQGAYLSPELLRSPNITEENVLGPQCVAGSEGRLCSKCTCDVHGSGDCWFLRGTQCARCRSTVKLSVSVPVLCTIVILLTLVIGGILGVVLQRKRVQSLKKFTRLHWLKRALNRLQLLVSLGNVSILITFVQILLSFTQWDAYAETALLGVFNADVSRLGLGCIFPLLNSPFWSLLAHLSVPFVALIILAAAVGMSSRVAALLEARAAKRVSRAIDHSDPSDVPIAGLPEEILVEYPAFALLTSMSFTLIKFFYFGTALASHQYLFSTTQHGTGTVYSRFSPWMKYSEAWTLILTSIPSILIFDFVFPIAFLVLCWKVRNKFNDPSIQIYFGSLFDTYNPQCFWWEIVNVLKKLSIALALRSFADSNPTQSALVASILLGLLVIQLSVNPWRRKSENIADATSSVILCGALLATRSSQLIDTSHVVRYILALSVLFVVGSIGMIVWHTFTGRTDYEKRVEAFRSRSDYGVLQGEQDDPDLLGWTLESESELHTKSEDSLLS